MCQEFGQLPSARARVLLPELDGLVSELDWYAFDVAAAWYTRSARQKAQDEEAEAYADQLGDGQGGRERVGRRSDDPATRRLDAYRKRQRGEADDDPPQRRRGVTEDVRGGLTISGRQMGEVPPWER